MTFPISPSNVLPLPLHLGTKKMTNEWKCGQFKKMFNCRWNYKILSLPLVSSIRDSKPNGGGLVRQKQYQF